MKFILSLLMMCTIVFAAPKWITHLPEGSTDSAVGIAEHFFPEHTQEDVAFNRARAKLIDKDEQVNEDFVIKQRYRDEEGNLYLWVFHKK